MDWMKYFDKKIIERGEEYYRKGKIANFSTDGLIRRATVIGTDEYSVEITFNTKCQLVAAKCNCPYAENGEYCKHMVAVLLYDEYGEVPFKPKRTATKRKLSSGNEEVDAFIKSVKKDKQTQKERAFKEELADFNDCQEVPVSQYKKNMTALISSYKHGEFISYWDAVECCKVVLGELYDTSELLLSNGRLKEAFDYSYFVMKKFSTTNMDDSDGEIGDVCSSCIDIWDKLILDESTCDYCFKKIYKYLQAEHIDDWYMSEQVECFFLNNFTSKKYFDIKIGYIDSKFLQAKRKQYRYEMELALVAKLEMLEKFGGREQEINDIIRQYWDYEKVEKFYIGQCINKKQYEEAERVLIELIDIPKQFGVDKRYCLQTLMDIYKQTQNDELYRNTLYRYVSELREVTMEKYIELKGLYSNEIWSDIIKKLLSCIENNNKDLYAKILLKENMKARLVDFVVSQRGLGYLKEYENDLRGEYSEKLLNKYCQELNIMVVEANCRDNYKEIVRLLRKMNAYEGGAKIVRQLVECWKLEYRRRPAFMQELNKVILN